MAIKYSRDCSEITLFCFDKLSSTNDYRYLIRDWDGYADIEFDVEKARELWRKIYDQYCTLTDDNKLFFYFTGLVDLNNMKAKKFILLQLLQIYSAVYDADKEAEFREEFRKWGFPIDPKKDKIEEIHRVTVQVDFMQNKIEMKEHEMDSLKAKGESEPLMQQVVKVERMTKREKLDPESTSVEKWVYILKELNERNSKNGTE